MNPHTEWMWPLIQYAEVRMEQLVVNHPEARGELRDVLNQAARELLLLGSSDWPLLVSTGQVREYAGGRFQQHLARFNQLASVADSGVFTDMNRHFLTNIADLDNPFPDIDYRVFVAREKPA